MGLMYQFIGTGILCFMSINTGLILWWPVSTISIFPSPNKTPLNRAMTETEMTLLLSLAYIGTCVSTILGGYLLNKIGRKTSSIVFALSFILFWVFLALFKQVEVVLTVVCLSGICSSASLVNSIYISEICQESIRGSLTACSSVFGGFGMLLIYGLGGFLSYDTLLYIGMSMPVIGAALLFLLKDSPVYLMQIGREIEAMKSIAFYRQLKTCDKQVGDEILTIKSAINPEFDGMTPENEKLNPVINTDAKLSFWQFMKKSKSSRRAIIVNLVLFTTSIFQGLPIVQTFAVPLFSVAIPSLSSEGCSVFLGIVNVASGILGAYLTDVVGRRNLMIYGSIATGICCVVLGTQMNLHWGPNWINAVFLYVFTVVYILGAGTVPMVLQAESFLPEVRSILSTVVIEWSWICYVVIFLISNPILNALGWGTLFFFFAVMCFLTAVLSVFFLPETNGLTVEEIQPIFLSRQI